MKKVKLIISILLVLALMVTLFACNKNEGTGSEGSTVDSGEDSSRDTAVPTGSSGGSTTTDSTTVQSQADDEYVSLTIGVTNYLGRFVSGMSPADNSSACDAVFDTLFKIDPVTKEIYSEILTDWFFEDDNTFVLTLRDGIYFSNGDKATSEDLLFAYMSHVERGSPWAIDLRFIPDECMVRDDFTVQIKVASKVSGLITSPMYLYNKKWADSVGWDSVDWYTPVGSGPYECIEYVTDDHMILRLRDNYWARDINDYYVDEYYIRYYPESSTMYMALERGDVDICTVNAIDYGRFRQSGGDGFDVISLSMGVTVNLRFGYDENPVWSDKRVREAVAYGVNWEELGQLVMGDLYIPANSVTPSSGPFYYDVGWHEYNPDKAIQLLAEAGYGPGDLRLTTYQSEAAINKSFGEAFTYYLDKIGINVDITYGDVSSTLAQWNTPGSGTHFVQHYGVNGSATYEIVASISGANVRGGLVFVYVDDDHFQELYNRLYESFDNPDMEYRKQLATELQQYIFDETLIIPFAEFTTAFGWRTDVLTESQIRSQVISANRISLSTLGLKSTWGG